jgi:YVTN family beta-propeller protein
MNFNLKKTNFFLLSGICVISIFSCEKQAENKTHYGNQGAFIANEGAFTGNNGTVSFYSFITDSVYNDIFYDANERVLGDVVQSIAIIHGKAYVVVNNSNKIEVTDTLTFESEGIIEGLSSPRYIVSNGNYGYVSCWGDNSVKVVDLATNEITASIPVCSGPDKMCISRNKLYVANSGGWSTDSMVSVIDLSDNELVKNIEVKYAPSDLVVGNDGNVWVLCFGKLIYGTEEPYPILEESSSKLYCIDTGNDIVITEILLYEHEHPMQLEVNSEGDLFYGGGYTFSGIYRFNTTTFTSVMLIDEFAYGLNIRPETDELYLTICPSYTSAGTLKIYSKTGELAGTYTCGIGPNSVVF